MKKILLCLLALMLMMTAASAATLTLPAKLTEIEEMAFYGDKSLDVVALPEGVLSIGSKAFANSSVKKINLPASLSSIASDAFSGCTGLTVTAPEGSYAYAWAVQAGLISVEANPESDFEFTTADGSATVTGYVGSSARAILPSTLGGCPVRPSANGRFPTARS